MVTHELQNICNPGCAHFEQNPRDRAAQHLGMEKTESGAKWGYMALNNSALSTPNHLKVHEG